MVYFDPIIHQSAGYDQFAFQKFHLAAYTDGSSFTTARAQYGQLIVFRNSSIYATDHSKFIVLNQKEEFIST